MKKKSLIKLLIFTIIIVVVVLSNIDFNKTKKITIKENKKEKVKTNEKIELKLKGIDEVTVVKNGVYEEYGAIGTINGEDASDKIKITNDIDFSKPGNYEITYSLNKEKIIRKVNVVEVTEPDTDGIPVMMYHYFYDDTKGETGPDSNYISRTNFAEELKYLKDNNYYFPNMKEIRKYVDGELELPSKSIVLTMDDGHEDNYTIAYPLAVEYKVPIVMFVVTSWTNVNDTLQTEMRNTGYVIMQSHTHDLHKAGCSGMGHGGAIMCVSYDEGVKDLTNSKNELNNSDSVAYPFGDNNEGAWKILQAAGFSLGFTTEYGKVQKGANPYALPRVRINGNMSLDTFINSI